MTRVACAALLAFSLSACDRKPPAPPPPPAAPAVPAPSEHDQVRAALESGAGALLRDYDRLRAVHDLWTRCGLPAFDEGPILERMIPATPADAAARVRRLRELDAAARPLADGTQPLAAGGCEGWRLAAGRDWLAAHPPNSWAAEAARPAPGKAAAAAAGTLTAGEERERREIETRMAERDLRLTESVKGLLSALNALALCHADADGDRALAKMLDTRARQASAPGTRPVSRSERTEIERYFHIRQKADRYGRQVYADMGLADKYRAAACTPDGIRIARSMIEALQRG